MLINKLEGLSCSSFGKESACNAGDLGLIPVLGRSPGGGNGNPLQYFCLENLMDTGAWMATVHGGHKESDMTEQLSTAQHSKYIEGFPAGSVINSPPAK